MLWKQRASSAEHLHEHEIRAPASTSSASQRRPATTTGSPRRRGVACHSLDLTSLHFTSLDLTSLHCSSLPFPSLYFTPVDIISLRSMTSLGFTSHQIKSIPFTVNVIQFKLIPFNQFHSLQLHSISLSFTFFHSIQFNSIQVRGPVAPRASARRGCVLLRQEQDHLLHRPLAPGQAARPRRHALRVRQLVRWRCCHCCGCGCCVVFLVGCWLCMWLLRRGGAEE